jgi:hypothetical protein
MVRGKITKRSVDSLIANADEGFLWDSSLKGFGVKRSKSGAVAYILQFRMGEIVAKVGVGRSNRLARSICGRLSIRADSR